MSMSYRLQCGRIFILQLLGDVRNKVRYRFASIAQSCDKLTANIACRRQIFSRIAVRRATKAGTESSVRAGVDGSGFTGCAGFSSMASATDNGKSFKPSSLAAELATFFAILAARRFSACTAARAAIGLLFGSQSLHYRHSLDTQRVN
jgi:hypothetical protein